ncbi:hypothetical protein AMJ52_00015 [candidate division TA06 bacterium DG_78]|uniref:Guanylate cyclase domain-containing protein n=1 Tax=candidate division TA06 bacterium DG_78 TaxID=1703772 RepID=A0A0S7YJC1_UNCT6|nr:MAG: hypothetical protein AMJ52_00015 [candidate division TA06 bacterium DG_78]
MSVCPFCNHQYNLKDAVFCTHCGTQLISEPKQTVTSDRLKFWGGELRLLSVFFVNIIGFEKFTDRDVYNKTTIYIRECLREIEDMIRSFDGTLNEIFPDDRILGIFGAPRAHYDDPIRAIRCAHRIKNWWLKKKSSEDLLDDVDITMGLHTGRAFFGYVLKELPYLTVIGDTINTACRLAEICPPHEIIMSQNTYDKVREYVDVEHLGERSVKGRIAKVDVYLVKDVKKKMEISSSQKMPLFGREEEIKKLITITEGIKENKSTFCIIRGQMGIGKTRLKEELENYLIENKSINFIETHCSTEVQSPYYPFKFLLRNYFKLNEFDSKELIAKKIDDIINIKGLTPIDVKGIKHLFLTDLRRLRGDEIRSINEEIYTSLKNLIRHECRNQPLVLVFEEFNRIDVMSLDFVSHLFAELENEPLMFLMVNISKESMATLSEVIPRLEELNIMPLSVKAIGDLVKFTLNDVDDKLIDFVYRTTGGNPLFAIEALRHVKRAKVIKEVSGRWYLEKEKRLPFLDDLYGVVMSTIDSLSSDYRLIIDYASVIGYSFGLRILQGLIDKPQLKEQLSYLINEGYIILSKNEHDPVYIFRHNLLKDAAYTVLPLRKRKEIHQHVAQLFETLYADQLSNFYENVGHHYLSCDHFKKAATYFKLAGDRAKNLYATEQAFSFYDTFLKIKKERGDEVPADLTREVFLHLADLYEITGNIQKMVKTATEGLVDAQKDKDLEREVSFTERNGYAQILLNKLSEAEESLLTGVNKCDGELPDILTLLYADLGILYAQKYEYEKSILYYNLSWNTARANDIKEGEILCLLNLSHLHRDLGNYEQALEYLNYGLEDIVPPDDMRGVVQFKQLIADVNYQIWDLRKAEAMLVESSTVSEAIGSTETYIKSALGLALIYTSNGNFKNAEKYLKLVDKKISFFIRENLLAEINLKKAIVYYFRKEFGKTRDYIANALKIAQKFTQREIECHCFNLLSLVDEDAPLKHALKAFKIAEMLKLPPLFAIVLFRLSQLYNEAGDTEKARYYGQKALLIYNDMKNKLNAEHRQCFALRPEYVRLLEM